MPDNVDLFFTDVDDYKVVFALFKNERVNSVKVERVDDMRMMSVMINSIVLELLTFGGIYVVSIGIQDKGVVEGFTLDGVEFSV